MMRSNSKTKAIFLVLMLAFAQVQAAVYVGFSRSSPSALDIVMQAIREAKSTIYLAAYQLTHPELIAALLEAQQRGVQVSVVLDRTQAGGSAQSAFVRAGVRCRIDARFRIMHHKFIITDDDGVELGSFNYSLSADKKNAENALYLTGGKAVADAFLAQWHTINDKATPCVGGGEK